MDKIFITSYDMMCMIAKDYNVKTEKLDILKLPCNDINIKKFVKGRSNRIKIFDGLKEHNYILYKSIRNEKILSIGIELRCLRNKFLHEIIKETGVNILINTCRICEGGGLYSNGFRYIYKNYYCEL